MFFDGPFGGGIAHAIGLIVTGLFSLFAFLIVAALLFVLVRFLLVGTKAAQIYVAKNSPEPAAAPAKPAATDPRGNEARRDEAARAQGAVADHC